MARENSTKRLRVGAKAAFTFSHTLEGLRRSLKPIESQACRKSALMPFQVRLSFATSALNQAAVFSIVLVFSRSSKIAIPWYELERGADPVTGAALDRFVGDRVAAEQDGEQLVGRQLVGPLADLG